jgi:ABC-type transport system involved in multi-copper enzyme maturation permease subunit
MASTRTLLSCFRNLQFRDALMSSLLDTCRTWLRHNASWSNSWQSWKERIGVAVLMAGAFSLSVFGSRLALSSQVALWALLLVTLAFLLRRGWLKLFGPVLFYDMLRVGRRSRYIFFRTLYALFLLLILSWVWSMWQLDYRYQDGVPAQKMAQFAESFFLTFMLVQLVLVVVLTPAYVAGAVAEEKDRKTLEFLLATDLRNREIVLSKLTARIANLALILLAGLPILSALQFLGGVDPNLLLASFAVVGLSMVSLASVSILFSVRCRRPRDAIVLTYLVVLLYPTLAFIVLGLFTYTQYLILRGYLPELLFGLLRDFLELMSNVLNSGNLLYVLFQLVRTLDRGGNVADTLPELIRDYALFHGIVTLVCVTWAVLRLRAIALTEPETSTAKPKAIFVSRPPVGELPMMWKEVHAEPKLRLGILGGIIIGILMVCSYIPPVIILVEENKSRWLGETMNVWVRLVGTPVACLMLLAVAVRASGSISGERDRQTLDALLTSPLTTGTILFSKWVGSILSVRWAWLWLGSIWLLGMVCGGMNPCGVPLIISAWLIYAGVFAAVGLWFSLTSRTTLRATVWTLLSVVFLGGGHWVVTGMCCFMPCGILMRSGPHDALELAAKFLAGQTPPFVLGAFAFHGEEFRGSGKDATEIGFFCILGLVTWAIGALILGQRLNARFQQLSGRESVQGLELVRMPGDAEGEPRPPGEEHFRPA